MASEFEDNLNNPEEGLRSSPDISEDEIIKEIEAENEKEYLGGIKKKNKGFLVEGLSLLERERISGYIMSRYDEALPKHKDLCDNIDEYDEVWRMVRQSVAGADEDTPNYRTPLSTVANEVIHANIMNVFFTPKDVARALPTEEGDIAKIKKLDTFMNWSQDNEMDLYENCDRLFHNSGKVGETPYMVHWVKEYGTEITRRILRNPANPAEPMYDPDTQEPIFQEVEEAKLLYNGPKLEILSRKDYIQPPNAMMDRLPEYEMRYIRMSYDEYLRLEKQGKMFSGSIKEIMEWSSNDSDNEKDDLEDDRIEIGPWNQEFIEFYGRMRIMTIKNDDEDDTEDIQELEDEFIAIVHLDTGTLCQLRKNKFPLKMRPIGMDYFMLDDEGRRAGIGIVKFLEGPQKAYDALFNQYILGTVNSNSPIGFFTPLGNQRQEPVKLRHGYMYPSSDPGSINFLKLPPPSGDMQIIMELIQQWAQLLFGISDFAAGVESKIDPDAPAKKAEIVVAQGNVRMNSIIKRKQKTMKDILFRWFLLYKANMPPNKFMRIVGDSTDNPWKFEPISLADFSLKSLPDFELVGNILNSNKSLEINKKIGIYQLLSQNPFFNPQTSQGIKSLHSLTQWLIDGLDETGLSRFLPNVDGETVFTPEEENARFLQGDIGEPTSNEDHINHIKVHSLFINDPVVPDKVKPAVVQHIQQHIALMQQAVTTQIAIQRSGLNPAQFGGQNGQPERTGASGQAGGVLPQQGGQAGLEGLSSGV